MSTPRTARAIVLGTSDTSLPAKGTLKWDPAEVTEVPVPELKEGEVLVKISAAGFNHRDVFIRQGLYPGIKAGAIMGSDGAGTVVASSESSDRLIGKRVFLTPSRGWDADPRGPERVFGIVGGTRFPELGTFAEYVAVERGQVLETPGHLTDVQAAAWPLAAVTAWRAVFVKAAVRPGQNVLITGIGGGVAIQALQFAVAAGANVWVTSGSAEKLERARSLGARGGVNYKDADWPQELGKLLPKEAPLLDVVIDSAGGEITAQVNKILRAGAVISVYGMTAAPKITFTMREVLKNIELKGSTMGSLQDLKDATAFMEKHKLVPVVHDTVLQGLESAEDGFELMKAGGQFGKIVIDLQKGVGAAAGGQKGKL